MNNLEDLKKSNIISEDLNIISKDLNIVSKDLNIISKNILDPFSVIVKLAILSKKPTGTKISIYNNTIVIQEVGIFQSLVRYVSNKNKYNIQYLYNPIYLACKQYLSTKNIKEIPKIIIIFMSAQNGITKLIETYKDHIIITHTLYMYSNIITNYLSVNFNNKLFIKDDITDLYTDTILTNFYSIWTSDKINMILNMFEFIEKGKFNNVKYLEEFMINIDNLFIN